MRHVSRLPSEVGEKRFASETAGLLASGSSSSRLPSRFRSGRYKRSVIRLRFTVAGAAPALHRLPEHRFQTNFERASAIVLRSPLTRRFAPPSPDGRGTRSALLPSGEGAAK